MYSKNCNGREIAIVEGKDEKIVIVNNITYSRINANSVYIKSYWDYFIPLGYLKEKPRILMISLGGGTIAYQFKELFGNRIKMDIVEIDEKIVEAAKKFYPDIEANIIVRDGASFLHGRLTYMTT